MGAAPAGPVERAWERLLGCFRPCFAAVGRTQIDVSQLQTGEIALRVNSLETHLLEELNRARPSLEGASGLFERDHQAVVGHGPGTDPAGVAGLLWRAIDRLSCEIATDDVLRLGRCGLASNRGLRFGHPRFVDQL